VKDIRMGVRKKLAIIQSLRQCYYEAYKKGEIDQKEYLARIYPLDMMIERLEISIWYSTLISCRQKRDNSGLCVYTAVKNCV